MRLSAVEVNERFATAVHEMGHATLCAVLDIPMRKIRTYNAFFMSWGGEVRFDMAKMDKRGWDFDDLPCICTIYLAGQEAESRWLCEAYGFSLEEARAYTRAGAGPDLRNFRYLSRVCAELGVGMSRTEFLKKTDTVLTAYWDELLPLASNLANHRRLNPSAVTSEIDSDQSVIRDEVA